MEKAIIHCKRACSLKISKCICKWSCCKIWSLIFHATKYCFLLPVLSWARCHSISDLFASPINCICISLLLAFPIRFISHFMAFIKPERPYQLVKSDQRYHQPKCTSFFPVFSKLEVFIKSCYPSPPIYSLCSHESAPVSGPLRQDRLRWCLPKLKNVD